MAVVAVNGALTVAFELAQSAWIARSTADGRTHSAQFRARRRRRGHRGCVVRPHRWLFQWLGAIVVMVADAPLRLPRLWLLTLGSESRRPEGGSRRPRGDSQQVARRALATEVQAGLRATAGRSGPARARRLATLVAFATSFASDHLHDLRLARHRVARPKHLWAVVGTRRHRVARRIVADRAHRGTHRGRRTWLIGSLGLWALGSVATPLATAAAALLGHCADRHAAAGSATPAA